MRRGPRGLNKGGLLADDGSGSGAVPGSVLARVAAQPRSFPLVRYPLRQTQRENTESEFFYFTYTSRLVALFYYYYEFINN